MRKDDIEFGTSGFPDRYIIVFARDENNKEEEYIYDLQEGLRFKISNLQLLVEENARLKDENEKLRLLLLIYSKYRLKKF